MLPALSRPRSEIAISVPANACRRRLGHEDQSLEPLVARQRTHARRHRDRLAAREQAVFAVVEAEDLVDALDPDIERTAIIRDRSVSYQPRSASGRPSAPRIGAISASAMRARSRALVDDAAAQPPALVAQGDESGAVRGNANGRDAAEIPVGRSQHEAAAEFQQSKLVLRTDREYRMPQAAGPRSSIGTGDSAREGRCARPGQCEDERRAGDAARQCCVGDARDAGMKRRGVDHASSLRAPSRRLGRGLLVEQLGELVGHGAAELLGIDDGDGAAIVARHVMADADGDQFDRRARSRSPRSPSAGAVRDNCRD